MKRKKPTEKLAAKPLEKKKGKPHRFKKGEINNPLGCHAHKPENKILRRMTREDLIDLANMTINGDIYALDAVRKDKSCTVMRRMIAAVCIRVIDSGSMTDLDKLLDRMIGKEVERHEHTGIEAPKVVVILPDNGRNAK